MIIGTDVLTKLGSTREILTQIDSWLGMENKKILDSIEGITSYAVYLNRNIPK